MKTLTKDGETFQVTPCGSFIRTSKGGRWRNAGKYVSVGTRTGAGYLALNIKGKPYASHRLVAEAYFGKIPSNYHVHHKDSCKDNNCVDNLEILDQASHQEKTSKESSSKYFGVSWHKSARKWEASAKVNGRKKYIGVFETERDAALARDLFCQKRGIGYIPNVAI